MSWVTTADHSNDPPQEIQHSILPVVHNDAVDNDRLNPQEVEVQLRQSSKPLKLSLKVRKNMNMEVGLIAKGIPKDSSTYTEALNGVSAATWQKAMDTEW